jgi:hypothetical protein
MLELKRVGVNYQRPAEPVDKLRVVHLHNHHVGWMTLYSSTDAAVVRPLCTHVALFDTAALTTSSVNSRVMVPPATAADF